MVSASLLLPLCLAATASAHTVLTYPGWRGDNLKNNTEFPYGMQWIYPCGGMNTTTNRTFWPVTGGAVAMQPGWFQGHIKSRVFINLGFGTDGPDNGPQNMSFSMLPETGLIGPTNVAYPGTICFPQVPLPKNTTVKAGDNATIQVVELAQHGAALYSCVDITFVEPNDPRLGEVNETNCFNSSDIGFSDVYTITTRASGQGGANATTSSAAAYHLRSGSKYTWSLSISWMPVVVLVGGLWVLA